MSLTDKEKKREYDRQWCIARLKCAREYAQWRIVHLAHARERARQWRLSRRLLGLCKDCPAKAVPGMTLCEKHLNIRATREKGDRQEYQREYQKQLRAKRIDQRLCPMCGRPLTNEEGKYCFAHSTHTHISRIQRRRLKADEAHYSKVA